MSDKSRRAPTNVGDRDRRRTPSSGIPAGVVAEEPTPPPQPMPELVISRSASYEDIRVAITAIASKVDEHNDAIGEVWESRHFARRLVDIEKDLKENSRVSLRSQVLLEEFFAPLVKEQTAKLETCLHYISASSHVAKSVADLGEKIDEQSKTLHAIEKEQVAAAEKFDAHDLRDKEIEKVVHRIDARVVVLEQYKMTTDTTAKVTKLVARATWWKSPIAKGLAAVLVATAGLITAYATLLAK